MELPDLDAIEARANAASDGPWIVVHESAWEADDVQHPDVIKVGAPLYVGDDEPVTVCLVSTDYEDDPVDVLGDAEFIAHARTDVPALVAALREARAEAKAAWGAPETVEPFLVPPGWVDSDFIAHPGGPTYRLLTYPDGMVRFEHRCNRGARGTIISAPALDPSHVITRGEVTRDSRRGVPTVTPSILCPDCGTHGFITNGRWRG